MKRERAVYWLRRVSWWLFCAAVLGWAFWQAATEPIFNQDGTQ